MFFLQQESSKTQRNKKICNLNQAANIGIVYFLPDEETYRKVSQFVKRLQGEGKTVKALGFVDNKSLTGQFLPKLSYDFLYHSGVNWMNKPVSAQAKDFSDTTFDILIDLSMEEHLPLLFITAQSKAGFKTGMQSKLRSRYLDLMISLENGGELDELIKQVYHYLNEINKDYEN